MFTEIFLKRLDIIKVLNYWELKETSKIILLNSMLNDATSSLGPDEVLNFDAIEIKFLLVRKKYRLRTSTFILVVGKFLNENDQYLYYIPGKPFNQTFVTYFEKGTLDYICMKVIKHATNPLIHEMV